MIARGVSSTRQLQNEVLSLDDAGRDSSHARGITDIAFERIGGIGHLERTDGTCRALQPMRCGRCTLAIAAADFLRISDANIRPERPLTGAIRAKMGL